MKKRNVCSLIVSMLFSLILTGCSIAKENIVDVINTINTEDVVTEDTTTTNTENVDIADYAEFESVDWASIGKYNVDELTDEKTKDGVYTLGYTSNEKVDDIFIYFDELLIGTSNYFKKEIPTLGGMLKGTINGHGITVSVQYDSSGDTTLVEFYSYDASMVAN